MRLPRPLIFTNVTFSQEDTCRVCGESYEQSLKMITVCSKCNKVLCFSCCQNKLCQECKEENA